MKVLGLVGGTSYISTIDYYKHINAEINRRLGGLQFADLRLHSFNYADISRHNEAGDWDATLDLVTGACQGLQQAGAEAIVLCANTTHKVADELQKRISIPIIHIATVTAKAIQQKKLTKVALLGTRFTMEFDFFKNKLTENGIETLIPNEADRTYIHQTINDELAKGDIRPKTRAAYINIINKLIAQGVQGVILGCTEIPLLIKPGDVDIPMFDTMLIHAQAAVEFALS